MATVLSICESALRMLGVVASGATASANDADAALVALNDMCAAWPAKDVHAGIPPLVLTDEFPMEDQHHGTVKAMLATYIAPEFGIEASPVIQKRAYDGWLLIRADFKSLETIKIDPALLAIQSHRYRY